MKFNMKVVLSSILLACVSLSLSAQTKTENSELQPMSYQIGKWLARDIQKTKEGARYQFGYELGWFDKNQTIVKMVITGVFEDGEVRIFWEGFKNWDPQDKKIYYAGYSPDGRSAKGDVSFEGDKVMTTNYSGFSPQGPVLIRDVATKQDDSHYTSVTNLKMPNADWRIVNTDHWVKVTEQKFNENLK